MVKTTEVAFQMNAPATAVEIPIFDSFASAVKLSQYWVVPGTWSVMITDVKGSTAAVAEGRYKDINVVGASSVMAVINALKPYEPIYIFGGDGATFLCPPEHLEAMKTALLGVKQIASASFGFDLRVGCVAVSELTSLGFDVTCARFRLSSKITQHTLAGEGLAVAEAWIKSPPAGKNYECSTDVKIQADTQGLECRWDPIHSKKGKIVSLLVSSISHDSLITEQVLTGLLRDIERITISNESRPIQMSDLKLATDWRKYRAESGARKTNWFTRVGYQLNIFLVTQLARLLWGTTLKKSGDNYKKDLIVNTDYRKFDGTLRMVLDLSLEQYERLISMLDERAQDKTIVYGIHASDSAMMTCLVFERSSGNHLHFVDGADGGYVMAAKELKAKMKENGRVK